MERATLSIDGMSCGHCVGQVRSALQKVSGVTVEKVEVGSAEVTFDPAKTDQEKLAAAVTDAGYEAKVNQTAAAPKAAGNCGCGGCR